MCLFGHLGTIQTSMNVSPTAPPDLSPPRTADLHAHTTASDGTTPPAELVACARRIGLSYLAVTDHDTTAGVGAALDAARDTELRLIPGVELSADGPPGKCHLLGLRIRHDDAHLNATLARLSENRANRNEKIAARFRALGIDLTLDRVRAVAPPGANVGRPHFAQTLVQMGIVASVPEAFARYLSDTGPVYVEKDTLTPEEAIALIHQAGGLCFLAHPGLLKLKEHETIEGFIAQLQAFGLDGIEAYYGMYSPHQTEQFLRLAQKRGLLVTGGSDFHGDNKPDVHLGAVVDGQKLAADLLPEALLAPAPSNEGF